MDDTIIVNGSIFIRNIRRNYIIQGEDYAMGNLYKNCKYRDNTAELIYEKGSLFVTIFENNIVHVAQNPASKVLQ